MVVAILIEPKINPSNQATLSPALQTKKDNMKNIILTTTLLTALAGAHLAAAAPMGTAFTYQGRLNDGGQPANNLYDLTFTLHDDPVNVVSVGTYIILSAVPVTNGLFTVSLNANGEFGPNAFIGQARWLQIGVRTNSANNAFNNFTFLAPRQPLTPAPCALFASNAMTALNASYAANVADGAITGLKLAPGAVTWSSIAGIPAGFADGVDNGPTYTAGAGLNLNWLYQLSVDFGGSGSATSVAHSDHGHFGSAWGGNASFGPGLGVTNGAGNGAGLYGQQGAGSGFPYIFGNPAGVWGESSQGSGVWGASATSAGVRGISLGTNGYGVYGATLATNGANFGVHGQSASTSGAGVRGLATATTGTNAGVSGQSASTSGAGVRGLAMASSGPTVGVGGESASAQGAGVFGKATSTTGFNYGVRGETASNGGDAMHGLATAGSGTTAGVSGQANSTGGVGVRGLATGPSGTTAGVRGEAYSSEGFGVLARNNNGVALKAAGTGIIQSDADSYVWIPASAAFGAYGDSGIERIGPQMLVLNRAGYDYNTIHCPLTVPGILYGQRTVLKSIEVFWASSDTNNYIYSTTVYESFNPNNPAHAFVDGIYTLYEDFAQRDSSWGWYTVPVNYSFSNTSGFLGLQLDFSFLGEGNRPIYLTGFKVRLGHN